MLTLKEFANKIGAEEELMRRIWGNCHRLSYTKRFYETYSRYINELVKDNIITQEQSKIIYDTTCDIVLRCH